MIHSIGNNLKHSAYMGSGEGIIGRNWCTFLDAYKKRAGHVDANSFFEMPLPRNFILPYTGVIFERKYYLKIWSIVCISSGAKLTMNLSLCPFLPTVILYDVLFRRCIQHIHLFYLKLSALTKNSILY